MATEQAARGANDLIAELERAYFWWQPVGNEPRSEQRIIAQAMNLATFDDIRRMERTLGPARLAQAMLLAQPGWFDGRSWEFWRGRLSFRPGHSDTRRAASEIA